MILRQLTVLHFDPPRVERDVCLRVEDGRIVEVAPRIEPRVGEPIEDRPGGVVMPGLVVGHHHLYSALARGMPSPPAAPMNFHEILRYVWWRLDQALDAESNYMSALVGAVDAALAGVTTIIDHHASPNAIEGSLDQIRRGIDDVGLRGVLCYETTDRHGQAGREAGLAENERFLRETEEDGNHRKNENCEKRSAPSHDSHSSPAPGGKRFAGLVGAHAAFTLTDAALRACADMAERFRCGVHIHAAEDPCDNAFCFAEHDASLVDRLSGTGILRPGTLLCHCTHLPTAFIERARTAGCRFAHCPRSNMNNSVGYAPTAAMRGAVLLGTDGIGGDLFEESRAAWFKSRDAKADVSILDIFDMMNESARFASERLGVRLGRVEAGAAADLVFLDYDPPTPLESGNTLGHWFFGLASRHVREVWVAGRPVVMDGRVIRVAPQRYGAEAREVARRLWDTMATIR